MIILEEEWDSAARLLALILTLERLLTSLIISASITLSLMEVPIHLRRMPMNPNSYVIVLGRALLGGSATVSPEVVIGVDVPGRTLPLSASWFTWKQ